MARETIRDLLEREPFQPFRVRASSGAAYDVRAPGLVVLLKSQVLIAEPHSDRYAVIPLLHVAGVELINGRSRRGKRRT
jgi:hypothetical protein